MAFADSVKIIVAIVMFWVLQGACDLVRCACSGRRGLGGARVALTFKFKRCNVGVVCRKKERTAGLMNRVKVGGEDVGNVEVSVGEVGRSRGAWLVVGVVSEEVSC